MENSSVPFRAFLGAILSVAEGQAVEASVFDRSLELNIVHEEEEEESVPTPVPDDGSREYKSPKGSIGPGPVTRHGARKAGRKEKEAALVVRTFDAPFYRILMDSLTSISLDFIIVAPIS